MRSWRTVLIVALLSPPSLLAQENVRSLLGDPTLRLTSALAPPVFEGTENKAPRPTASLAADTAPAAASSFPRPAVFPAVEDHVTTCSHWATNGRVLAAGEQAGDLCAPCDEFLCSCCAWWCGTSIPPRVSVRHDIGDGVGYENGFTYLEGFMPLWQPDERSLLFSDLRAVNFDHGSRWEFNGGGGYRSLFHPLDVVLGVNVFYDGRHTDSNFFHQIGVGGEALFGFWEVRCNGYFIVGNDRQLAFDSGPVLSGVVGNQVLIDRFQRFEVAMGGVEVEVGAPLPVLTEFAPRAYVGYYHYDADGMPAADGIRGRLEAWATSRLSVHFAIQNDTVFDTTVSGGLALHFGGAPVRRDDGPRSVEERLGHRVVRDVNLVIAEQNVFEREQFALRAQPDVASLVLIPSGSTAPPPGGSTNPPDGWLCPPDDDDDRDDDECDDDDDHRPGRVVCVRWPKGFHHKHFKGHKKKWLCFFWPRDRSLPHILR